MKSKSKHQQIESTIQKIKEKQPKIKKSLRYLTGELKEQYIRDIKVVQRYAELNRKIIADKILYYLDLDNIKNKWHTVHNYIGDDNIIRKGAVSAKEGEKLLIPLNMKDGSLICEGLGNPDWNYSAPHGAGRKMSRTEAKETLDYKKFQFDMKDIYSSSINISTLDEAPDAYKDMDSILPSITGTVEIKKHIKPIYNYKDN